MSKRAERLHPTSLSVVAQRAAGPTYIVLDRERRRVGEGEKYEGVRGEKEGCGAVGERCRKKV